MLTVLRGYDDVDAGLEQPFTQRFKHHVRVAEDSKAGGEGLGLQ